MNVITQFFSNIGEVYAFLNAVGGAFSVLLGFYILGGVYSRATPYKDIHPIQTLPLLAITLSILVFTVYYTGLVFHLWGPTGVALLTVRLAAVFNYFGTAIFYYQLAILAERVDLSSEYKVKYDDLLKRVVDEGVKTVLQSEADEPSSDS